MDNIKFRPCTPKDVDKAVPLIYSSGPDAFNYVFKNDQYLAQDFLTFAFESEGGEFSYENHYGLTKDGEILGVGATFTGHRADSFTFKDLMKIVKFYGFKSIPVLKHGLRIEKVIRLPIKEEICLAHIGVEPSQRSKGYGQKLMECLMNVNKTNIRSKYILDVSEKNPRAQALYERMGFVTTKLCKSSLKNEFGQIVNHYRMEKSPFL